MQFKISLIILICLLSSARVLGQPSFAPLSKKEAAKIPQNILAVVTKEKDERVVKRLKNKPRDLKSYESSLIDFNKLVTEVAQKEWDLSEVKIISEADAEKLKNERAPGVSLLEIGEIRNYKIGDFYDAGKNSGFNSPSLFAYHMSTVGSSVALIITNADNPKRDLVVSYLPAHGVTKGTVTFMIRHLKNQITDCLSKDITSWGDLKKIVEANSPQLKSKTLLFFEPVVDSDVINAVKTQKISEHYSFKCEIATLEKVEEILIGKNQDYAIPWVVPAGASNPAGEVYNYFIIGAADAQPLFVTGHGVTGRPKFDFKQLDLVRKKLD